MIRDKYIHKSNALTLKTYCQPTCGPSTKLYAFHNLECRTHPFPRYIGRKACLSIWSSNAHHHPCQNYGEKVTKDIKICEIFVSTVSHSCLNNTHVTNNLTFNHDRGECFHFNWKCPFHVRRSVTKPMHAVWTIIFNLTWRNNKWQSTSQ